jgi:hypothetical protein
MRSRRQRAGDGEEGEDGGELHAGSTGGWMDGWMDGWRVDLELELELLPGLEKLLVLEKLLEREMDGLFYTRGQCLESSRYRPHTPSPSSAPAVPQARYEMGNVALPSAIAPRSSAVRQAGTLFPILTPTSPARVRSVTLAGYVRWMCCRWNHPEGRRSESAVR